MRIEYLTSHQEVVTWQSAAVMEGKPRSWPLKDAWLTRLPAINPQAAQVHACSGFVVFAGQTNDHHRLVLAQV